MIPPAVDLRQKAKADTAMTTIEKSQWTFFRSSGLLAAGEGLNPEIIMQPAFAIVGALLALAMSSLAARAEVQDCIPITALPAVISVQGIHCFKQDLNTVMTTGNAITINANNVTIDMNGYKLGGLGAGPATQANGIYALNRLNITLRNGSVRGFKAGIYLIATAGVSSGHLVEDMRIEGSRSTGILVNSANSTVRNNFVLGTNNTYANSEAYGIFSYGSYGVVIEDNVLTDVTSKDRSAYGIFIQANGHSIVARNMVQNVTVANNYDSIGISGLYGNGTVFKSNMIVNSGLGKIGLRNAEFNAVCSDNIITNYTMPATGC